MNLLIELPDEKRSALNAKARAQGVSAEEYARRVLEHDLEGSPRPRRHISEIIRENMKRVPLKSWRPGPQPASTTTTFTACPKEITALFREFLAS